MTNSGIKIKRIILGFWNFKVINITVDNRDNTNLKQCMLNKLKKRNRWICIYIFWNAFIMFTINVDSRTKKFRLNVCRVRTLFWMLSSRSFTGEKSFFPGVNQKQILLT